MLSSAMASTSSSRSKGKPTMKYILMTFHPAWKVARTAVKRSFSSLPLLMTRRMRALPASGAMVKPLLRTRLTCSASSAVNVSVRKLGNDAPTISGAYCLKKSSSRGLRQP